MYRTGSRQVRTYFFAAFIGFGLCGCTPLPIEGCDSTDAIHVVCHLDKPEDLARLPGTPWLLISELGSGSTSGQVVAFNPVDDQLVRLSLSNAMPTPGFPVCGEAPVSIRPRGFHLSTAEDGTHRLLLVNVANEVRIERYRVETGAAEPELWWEGCVAVPNHLNPNDVARLPGGGFVISHMFMPPMGLWLRAKMFFGLNTGYVARWLPQNGWEKVPGTDVSFANGIEVDPVSGRIFVAATYGETLTAVDADGGNLRRVSLPVQPDNLTWSPAAQLVAVGHTGVALFGTNDCRTMAPTACAFPFAVVQIDPQSMAVDVIYRHGEGLIPGPSVALRHEQFLFLGTFFGDRVSRMVAGE
jgi:hypothetical protein